MKKLLSLLTAMAVALQLIAAPVDVSTAKTKADAELYSGDITTAKGFDEIIIPDITGTSYAVTGLQPATTYLYDVRAVSGNIHGAWSNKIEVATLAGGLPGDVDGDGVVTSYDVTALYNLLLNGDDSGIVNGDQDGDGVITASDITTVYSILLGNKK